MAKTLIAGLGISFSPASLGDPATVTLHKLGGETSWLNPEEARDVARALRIAADGAESNRAPNPGDPVEQLARHLFDSDNDPDRKWSSISHESRGFWLGVARAAIALGADPSRIGEGA